VPVPEERFELVPHTRVRRAIGQRTLTSVNTIPQFAVRTLVDAEPLVEFRQGLKASGGEPVPTFNDLTIKAAAFTLRQHPRFNAWCDDEQLKMLESINVGFAVSTEQGVLLPTVREADRKSLAEIAAETRELIDLARQGRLRASLQMGAGFTVSNLGPVGIDEFAPIISPPQVAILGVGSIMPRPLVVDGEIVARASVYLTLVMDHRAADGAEGSQFLATLAQVLTRPDDLTHT
jgi:pyruvate dehydrogenase E2 component (dihydrolipoamide acetyltransferase)